MIYQFDVARIKLEPEIGNDARLRRDGANAGDILKRLDRPAQAWINERLAAMIAGVRSAVATDSAGRRVIQFIQGESDSSENVFNGSMMSDGTIRALAILIALRQFPEPSAVMIDEIEDSIHPFAQGVLLDAIEEMSEQFPVVVSTHNPEILSHESARPERVRVIEWKDGVSGIYHLTRKVQEETKPPDTVGWLLRDNALWTDDEPMTCGDGDDFFRL